MNTSVLRLLVLLLPLSIACDPGSAEDDFDEGETGTGDTDSEAPGSVGSFFLPTDQPDNTTAPVMRLDGAGGLHAVYPAYAGGDAFYAYCGQGCESSDEVEVVRLTTDGTTSNAMLDLDEAGHPRVLLATFGAVYYASCDEACTDPSQWTVTEIVVHGGNAEITGQAFALDAQGRPRFLMHTYVALLGVGQQPPQTQWVGCDQNCHDPQSWTAARISEQIWKSSRLLFDAQGRARVATVVTVEGENGAADQDLGAYFECDAGCGQEASWRGIGLAPSFSSYTDAVTISPSIAMDLAADGGPRVAVLSHDEQGARNIVYLACDERCTEDNWAGTILTDGDGIGPGLDLALDASDHPRLVYTFDYNIGLAFCDGADCTQPDSGWDLVPVERADQIPTDQIFLWPNCTVGAWFLHSPSLVLTPAGAPRVGYQARDISGGWSNPNPDTEPDCVAGTDMTLSRLALMPAM